MKNVRVKVTGNCRGSYWWFGIYEGKKPLMHNSFSYHGFTGWISKFAAIRNAKAMAKRIGIKYDSEIIKQHGC